MHLQCRCLHWNVLNAAHSYILALELVRGGSLDTKANEDGDNAGLEVSADGWTAWFTTTSEAY